jgi:nicotinate-nucleotide pyrophosphorylase (carboxylating)
MLALLAAERTALNFLCHLSGVATLAARYAAEVGGTGCVVRDTRKTLPGMRMLQKAAVAAGGGTNHRMGLYDGLLVKDNHVAAAGGVAAATRAALDHAGGLTVQVEVDDLAQLDEALGAGVRTILLDNFDVESLRTAVARCRNLDEPVFLEASGGITLDSVRDIAATGVDAIAVGALTHSAPGLDIGLDYGEDA